MENKKIIDNLLEYHTCILHLAESKCRSREDAEDLVSDTYLAALEHIRRGGSIDYPKTWLANTFMHKWNDSLRKRYRMPMVVNFDTLHDTCDVEEHFAADDDEAAELRKRVLYLTRTTREVIMRHYFFGEELKQIARSLDIPEGTVKSRLAYGREQIRKGFGTMENNFSHIPGTLNLSWSGRSGRDMRPASLIDGDLIAQNLLILAYDKPLDIAELAKMIGIPTVYIEPIIDRLTDGELMVRTDGGKIFTDFIIYNPQDRISHFDVQLEFVRENYGVFRKHMVSLTDEVKKLAAEQLDLRPRQLIKLERFALLNFLQNFTFNETCHGHSYPKRKDGGAWNAIGNMFPQSYDREAYDRVFEYTICGGLRTSSNSGDTDENEVFLQLCEFDTTLCDSPRRFACTDIGLYFKWMHKYLWNLHTEAEQTDIPAEILSHTEDFAELGLVTHIDGKTKPDIPIMETGVYNALTDICRKNALNLKNDLGKKLSEMAASNMMKLPPHLKERIPEFQRKAPSICCIEMAAVREAYDRGEHLAGVDYCCPPVVLIYHKTAEN